MTNGVYEFYFGSCMNIIFNELRQQPVMFIIQRAKFWAKSTHLRRGCCGSKDRKFGAVRYLGCDRKRIFTIPRPPPTKF